MRLRSKIGRLLMVILLLANMYSLYLNVRRNGRNIHEVQQSVKEIKEVANFNSVYLELLKILTEETITTQGGVIDVLSQMMIEIVPYVEPRPSFEKLKDANVTIHNIFSNSKGSGVIIKNGQDYSMILTAAHVIGDSKFVIVKHGTTLMAGVTVLTDDARDLALLKVFSEIGTALLIAKAEANYGEHIYSVSNPLYLDTVLTEGVLSGVQEVEGRDMNVVTLDTVFGSSGGMVTNNRGELIGIVSRVAMCPVVEYIEEEEDGTTIPEPEKRKKKDEEISLKTFYHTTTYNYIVNLEDIQFFLLGLIDFDKE